MAKCSECGAVVAEDLKFCGYCGAKLNVINEHLGTQILGNTQAILNALSSVAPTDQWVVLGTAKDGPLADGLIVKRTGDSRSRLLWSDGGKLTEVNNAYLLESYERGTLDVNPDLVDTCKDCLTRYHRSRRVAYLAYDLGTLSVRYLVDNPDHHIDSGLGCSDYWQPQHWAEASRGGGTCPVCTARRVLTPDYLIERHRAIIGDDLVKEINHDYSMASYGVPNSVFSRVSPGYLIAGTITGRGGDIPDVAERVAGAWYARRKGRAQLDYIQRKIDKLEKWYSAVEAYDEPDTDRKAFIAVSESLPDIVSVPVSSYIEMQRYIWSFMSLMGLVTISLGAGDSVKISPNMYYSDDIRKALYDLAYGWGQ